MKRSEKKELVDQLKNELESSSSVIVSHYSGLTVNESEQIRAEMRNNGAKFKVTKNRLTKLALEQTKFKDLIDLFSGPTAISYSDDPVAPAKVSSNFAKKFEKFKIIGGGYDGEKIDIEKIEKYLNFEISKNQNIIEYSPDTFKYLRTICDLVQKNDGGMLIIDYGYADSKMHETLQAVNNHKYSNILENIGDSDITYNISFHSFEKFISQFKEINSIFTNQKKFLTSMGILQRAEIISKNIAFSKKADLFYRVRRLIDENQMGELFKVMLIKNRRNNFKTGFQN